MKQPKAEKNLRQTILVAHDHIHKQEFDKAHEALHCGLNGKAPESKSISLDLGPRIQQFSEDFNAMCLRYAIKSAFLTLAPMRQEDGKVRVSVQMGGSIDLIKMMQDALGMGPKKPSIFKRLFGRVSFRKKE